MQSRDEMHATLRTKHRTKAIKTKQYNIERWGTQIPS